MNKKMLLILYCIICMGCGCLTACSEEIIMNISETDISAGLLYTYIPGECAGNEVPAAKELFGPGYTILDEDCQMILEQFNDSMMNESVRESYTYNMLIDMNNKKLMFNTEIKVAFFYSGEDVAIYEMPLTDEQNAFVKEIEKKYTEADENFSINSIGYLVNFSNVKKMDVDFIITAGSCETEKVPEYDENMTLHRLSDEEKTAFRESFGELRVELCLDKAYDYDCIISVGEKLLMIDMDAENIYLVYDRDKVTETYYFKMTEIQKQFIKELLGEYN